jgi:hypothetical protein
MSRTLDDLLDLTADALRRGDLAALPDLTQAILAQADTPPRDQATADRLRGAACGPRAHGWATSRQGPC